MLRFESIVVSVSLLAPLAIGLSASGQLAKKSPSQERLTGGQAGRTRPSDYPSHPIAPRGIKAADGRLLMCYSAPLGGGYQLQSTPEGRIKALALTTAAQLIFFDKDGLLVAPPQMPRSTVAVAQLKASLLEGRGDESSGMGTPAMEFPPDEARVLFLSLLVAAETPESLIPGMINSFSKSPVERAYLYMGPDVLSIVFTGQDRIVFLGPAKGFK